MDSKWENVPKCSLSGNQANSCETSTVEKLFGPFSTTKLESRLWTIISFSMMFFFLRMPPLLWSQATAREPIVMKRNFNKKFNGNNFNLWKFIVQHRLNSSSKSYYAFSTNFGTQKYIKYSWFIFVAAQRT